MTALHLLLLAGFSGIALVVLGGLLWVAKLISKVPTSKDMEITHIKLGTSRLFPWIK